MTTKAIYLPGLNGIRAFASIAVVVSHITLALKSFGLNPHIFGTFNDGKPRGLDLAGYGVSMFFCLSGFLITYLLLHEKSKNKIDIKKFYLRRILRIWPLYYLYLTLCIITYYICDIIWIQSSLVSYILYAANIPFILGGTLPFLAHYWSLGVEEQFYMFWPWLCRFKINTIVGIATIAIILLIGLKTMLHLFFPNSILESAIHITRFHCMLIGAIAAILYYTKNPLFMKIATNKFLQFFVLGLLVLVICNLFHVASFIDNELITVITAFFIIGQITKTSILNMENIVFDFLGKISYGIYVIHPLLIYLFAYLLTDLTSNTLVNYFSVYLIILSTSVVLSYVSYTFFESYFLHIKTRKYTVVNSSNVRNTN